MDKEFIKTLMNDGYITQVIPVDKLAAMSEDELKNFVTQVGVFDKLAKNSTTTPGDDTADDPTVTNPDDTTGDSTVTDPDDDTTDPDDSDSPVVDDGDELN